MASFHLPQSNEQSTNTTLDKRPHNNYNPILTNVTSFSAAHIPAQLSTGARALCYWPDTKFPLVAEKYNSAESASTRNALIISLNAYCIAKTVSDYGYDFANTSVPHLIHNCFKYAADRSPKKRARSLQSQLYNILKSRKDVLVDVSLVFKQ